MCDTLENRHYLAHPSSDDDDDLGYVDGYCGWFQCECRDDEQVVINEITNAGGIGFVAHPHNDMFDWNWSLTGFTGLEIINGGFSGDDALAINNPGGVTDSWVEFLEEETNPSDGFIRGTAGSDAHYTEASGENHSEIL